MSIGMRFSPSHPRHLPAWKTMNRNRADFDMDRLSLPLTVRPVLPGDRFKPLGAAGTQKIKKFFIDHKVSRHVRATTAVLADQQRIIWLVGQRIDDHVRVTPKTSKILSVEFFLLDNR
jgi:tRNA(Ile)-lysidine synthase